MSSTNSKLTRVADNIRILSAAMVEKAKSGHPGGAMGGADFMAVLYTEFLRYDPDQMDYPFRDRFFLDPGHMSPMLYSTLALAGTYTVEDLRNLRQWGSVTPGHPEVDVLHGVENTSGPLGQGHAMALGAAIAERFLAARFGEWQSHKTYAYISDGGIEEEVSQGVGRIAGHLGMNNLIMYYDSNNVQLSTKVDEVDTENVAMKYEAWGWNVLTIDGHDVDAIRAALTAAYGAYAAACKGRNAHVQYAVNLSLQLVLHRSVRLLPALDDERELRNALRLPPRGKSRHREQEEHQHGDAGTSDDVSHENTSFGFGDEVTFGNGWG